jgi:hypothetical protein
MEKISLPIAATLAEEAIKIINKTRSSIEKKRVVAAKDSQEFKQLMKIQMQRQILDSQFESISERFEKKFPGVEVNGYGKRLHPRARYKSQPQVKSIKNKIIVANQIKGIAPSKVIDFVVQEYMTE